MDTMAAAAASSTEGVTDFLNDERRTDGTDGRLPDDAQHLHQPPEQIPLDDVQTDDQVWTAMMKAATNLGMENSKEEYAHAK